MLAKDAAEYLKSKGFLNAEIPATSIGVCDPPMALATGGLVSNQAKVLDQKLWDTIPIDNTVAGEREINFFRSRRNAAGALKDRCDTNMPGDGKLPAPQNFTVHGVAIQVLPAIGAALSQPSSLDLQRLRSYSWWVFKQGETEITRQPVEYYPGPGLQSRYNNAAVATVGGHLQLGSGLPSDIHWLGYSITIPASFPFTVELHTDTNFGTPSVNYRIRIWLVGFLGTTTQ